jgi:hypothetical protein
MRFGPLFCLLSTALCLAARPVAAQAADSGDPRARRIVACMDSVMNPATSEGILRLEITTSTGAHRTFRYRSTSRRHGADTRLDYLEPARVRGQVILLLDEAETIWIYFPRTDRLRRLARHAKRRRLEGSDFAYEDLGGGHRFLTDFAASLEADTVLSGRRCWRIRLDRLPDGRSSYRAIRLWVDRETTLPLRVDYFVEGSERPVKRLLVDRWNRVQGRPTPLEMTMVDLERGGKSRLVIESVRYDLPVEDRRFEPDGLRP